jgi:trigger factor
MQLTREDLNPCTVKLTIVCDPEEVKDGFEKATKQIAKSIKLDGFRPGHAPKGMIESLIDKGQLYDEAADHLVRTKFRAAMNELKINADQATRPSVNLEELNHEEGKCKFTVKVPLPPIVEVGDYKGLPLERPPLEVTDKEVDYQLDEIRKRRSTRVPITDRGLQEGDVAVVNVRIDGEATDGRNFMSIVGQTFPELDEALTGMKVEEMKHLELKFPKTFQEKDWAGKKLKCIVTANSASAVQMPELDSEFAKSLESASVDELKAKLKEQISKAKQQMVREVLSEQAMEKLLERSKVEVSDNSWEDIANRRLAETKEEQEAQGKTLESYAEENGMSLDELVKAWQERAALYIRRAFLIREVFTKERMQLNNAELNAELFAMAREYEVQPEEMLKTLERNQALEELRFRAISRKVSNFLIECADIKEGALSGVGS